MRKTLFCFLVTLLVAGIATADETHADAAAIFARLKSMEGTWTVAAEAPDIPAEKPVHVFRASANGSVVMETMFPGTDHEMINMYHLDGGDLVLTHYCAAGNQPTMRLDRAHATPTAFTFEFTGGTNLDPAVDEHIHGARFEILGDDRVDAYWTGWTGGAQAGEMKFALTRVE